MTKFSVSNEQTVVAAAMTEHKWVSAGGYGSSERREIVGPLYLKVWWWRGMGPEESTLPPFKASVFGHVLSARFNSSEEAKEAAEKLALEWAQAAVAELQSWGLGAK